MNSWLKRSGLLACLLSAAHVGNAQEVFSLERFAIPEPVFNYQPDITAPTQRFAYDLTFETRPQKAARTFRLALGGIPGELGQLVTFPVRDPKSTALFLLGTAALVAVDRHTTGFWQDKVEPIFDGFSLPPLTPISNISQETQYVIATVGLTYVGGLAFNNERAQTAALLSGKAIAYSYVATQVILKPLFGRLRPVDNLTTFTGDEGEFTTNPWDFGNGGGSIPWTGGAYATSMPSYHFTQYFAMARVYSEVYDNKFWPYLAASIISVANIRGHNHWVSDMVAGAVVGTAVGNLVLNNYEKRHEAQNNLFIIPSVSRNSVGFALTMEF
ncbi:MAG: phosphatase PAP2 family protein [Rhodobacteraceae bacterium]|nr:phosphatase PAP2 family protein [Paracoccaceae bacterium]